MGEALLTPSKVTAWLACPHYLALRGQIDRSELQAETAGAGSFSRLVMDKGITHELACLEAYRAAGRTVAEIEQRAPREPFSSWVERVGALTAIDGDVLYQAPLMHDGMRGIADFLVRVVQDGKETFEPVDAKLARNEAKPGHVLQLCFYAEAIEAITGVLPAAVHVWLGSGETETIRTSDVLPYWRRLRRSVASALTDPAPDGLPEPCSHWVVLPVRVDRTRGRRLGVPSVLGPQPR